MKRIKNAVRILFFLVLLFALLGVLNQILQNKESETVLQPFLADAQEYDVLFLGDSQVRAAVFPMELFDHYGITAYNLGSSNCRIPMSYWKLMNALDYMTPKLVVLSVTDAERPELTHYKGEQIHEAFDGFPLTLMKSRAILDLTNQEGVDKSGVSYRDIGAELFFPLRKYHSRWSDLEEADFRPVYNKQKGAVPLVHVSDPIPSFGLAEPDEYLPEAGNGYSYLRRTIEECQKRGIPILLYQPPYPIEPAVHRGIRTAAKIAVEYNVPLLDFPQMNSVVDYYIDCGDPGSHLNPSGAKKLTDYLGQYIKDHYDMPDRREHPAYAHWNDEWNAYVDGKIQMIADGADSLRTWLMLLHDEDFNLVLTVRPNFDYNHHNTKNALQNVARPHVYEGDGQISAELEPLQGLGDAAEYNEGYMLIVDRDAESEYESVQEYYGIGEQEFETSFGYVFCRMDGEWIDLSITPEDGEEVYYFDNWDDQDQDMRLVLIDRRTGKPALTMVRSRTAEENL